MTEHTANDKKNCSASEQMVYQNRIYFFPFNLLTVSCQAIKSAMANPVKNLKSE